ncbi:alpha/beta hydrolase [Aliifodinibius sp. S!AR15-10]|uniref:alpha/beta hydrolase n=1 Tax=Aliifodinibius sp. S!AR15-10 TaxID=2950437 RepID=UPI00285B1483|nr:alpha/beta hydrolase [Aliifodinibius sp. S!AR15-10]MDR8392651.1 alpha/beta hydrolase [Aliifodinibius sp. S!AR15-10]
MVQNHLTLNDTVSDIVNHPAFEGFGELLLPWENNSSYYDTPLRNVGRLMPYHSNVQPEGVLSALNDMIDEVSSGRTIFYNFYSEQQKQQDPSKKQTGLFLFRGEPRAPFAIVSPGGGFSYVGSLHEGFPLAQEISKQGLNAFVIRYRTGSGQIATDDLSAAISYIINNAEKLGVSANGYSLWGGSAGARMVGNIALHGVSAFVDSNLPKPAATVIAYTGQSTYSSDFPPTFITVAENDWIVNVSGVEQRVQNLRNAGVDVEYRKYETAGHGFGTGQGTDAEGWMKHAVNFWETHLAN